MSTRFPPLGDLASIGDRRTAALIDREATVCWYSPHRIDHPSLFNALLDPRRGAWRVSLPGATPRSRRYIGASAVLETRLALYDAELVVTDWLTMGRSARPGLFCRTFSRAPGDVTILLDAWPGGRHRGLPVLVDGVAVFEDGLHLFASQPLKVDDRGVHWTLPRGQAGWAVLSDGACDRPRAEDLDAWKTATIERWEELGAKTTYDGPYRAEVAASLRQLRLLVYEPTGAIAAAITAGLPEVLGGRRNYDYRYSWLRDTGMVVRALLKTASAGAEGEAFLSFIALAREHASRPPLDVVVAVDGRPVPEESSPPLVGYEHSHPVRIGNRAGKQRQLGSYGNLLLAADQVYRKRAARPHWDTVESVADFLVAHWREPDSGLWESPKKRQYTASKVFAACSLETIAPFADPSRREVYRQTAKAIRGYVMRHCLTREGAFAAFAGSQGVDVSAALFPVWSFCAPDSPEMTATLHVLHRDYERGGLFKREDETPQSALEGAFLPGTFWIAQYWAARGDAALACRYIEAGLAHANDLGLFPEEVDWQTGRGLGNLPLGMTHASFLNAVADLAAMGARTAAREKVAAGDHD